MDTKKQEFEWLLAQGYLHKNLAAAMTAMEVPRVPSGKYPRITTGKPNYERNGHGNPLPGLSYETIMERSGLCQSVMSYVIRGTRQHKRGAEKLTLKSVWCIVEVICDELYSGRYVFPTQLRGLTIERFLQEELPFHKITKIIEKGDNNADQT